MPMRAARKDARGTPMPARAIISVRPQLGAEHGRLEHLSLGDLTRMDSRPRVVGWNQFVEVADDADSRGHDAVSHLDCSCLENGPLA